MKYNFIKYPFPEILKINIIIFKIVNFDGYFVVNLFNKPVFLGNGRDSN